MTVSKLLTAAGSIASGLLLVHCAFGSSSVAPVSCVPSRDVVLQPRWLDSAFGAAGIPASFEAPEPFEGMPLLSALHSFVRPAQPLQPTLAFLVTRIVAEVLAAILVVVATARGTSALSDSAARWLIMGEIGIASLATCTVAMMFDNQKPFDSFLCMIFVGFASAVAVGALAAIPVIVGLLPTRLIGTRASMTPDQASSQQLTKDSVRRDEAGAVALSRAGAVFGASG